MTTLDGDATTVTETNLHELILCDELPTAPVSDASAPKITKSEIS